MWQFAKNLIISFNILNEDKGSTLAKHPIDQLPSCQISLIYKSERCWRVTKSSIRLCDVSNSTNIYLKYAHIIEHWPLLGFLHRQVAWLICSYTASFTTSEMDCQGQSLQWCFMTVAKSMKIPFLPLQQACDAILHWSLCETWERHFLKKGKKCLCSALWTFCSF